MSEDVILLEHDGPISVVTVNRPDKLNALNRDVLEGLGKAVEACVANETRCLIVTGAGKAFVAGADIAAMREFTPEQAAEFASLGHRVGHAMEAAPFPIVAAINGFALGGGCELALACDFAFASTKAKLGQPEVNLAVIPGFGGTQRLLRRVGLAMARELVYTGKMIDAAEALRIGLVNAVFEPDQLMAEAKKTAALIASKGPFAIAAAKKVFNEGADLPLAKANEAEIAAFGSCFTTSDQKEGMAAFVEKREAKFTGR
ncbi:MAG: enoyl-CoA hydratase/isomerase family protein [Sandaracinus sp.]|nr:enoyl-CoA hydratase/isomerase family protein [Sandaracinus sp.]